MNRIDRLFGIILVFQNKTRVRSQDLADKFEVSKRTVYRDIAALSEIGLPIVSLPGEGYELMKGYFLSPLSFNIDEAIALSLGGRILIEQASGNIPQNVENALAKITAVLPEKTRKRIDVLTDVVRFVYPNEKFNLEDPWILTLIQAVQEKRVVKIKYHSFFQDQQTHREIEPHHLYYFNKAWYIVAYCRLRQAMREFKLDRIEELVSRTEQFTLYAPLKPPLEITEVQIRFDSNVVRWVRERQHFCFQDERILEDGDALMSYQINPLTEIHSWILSWGASAEVLSPKHLRNEIRQEAKKLFEMLT